MICSHNHISDFAELHFLHSICKLSSVVCPPLLQGTIWSPSMSSKAYAQELGLEYGPVNYYMMCGPKYANDLGEIVQ